MSKYEWDLGEIKIAVKESINFTEVLDKIGVPRQGNNSKTLKNILDTNNIDYSHFTGRARSYKTSYISASEYLNSDKKIGTFALKKKLLKVQAEAKAAANRALVSAGLTPAERAEWDYKTAVGVAQALAESKVSWVPSVMFGGGSSSNSAMDAVGLKMLLDITKSLEKTSK